MSETISRSELRKIAGEWIAAGKSVAGPTRIKPDLVLYATLGSVEDLLLDGFLRPANSIKEFVFPRQEKLYGYRIEGNTVEIVEDLQPPGEQVVIAARACDAAALPILDHVFNWDVSDSFYNRRRQATSVITLACREHDDSCFCTSVGLSPVAESGSDVLLLELGPDHYEVRCLTEKGRALFHGKTEPSDQTGTADPGPANRLDPQTVSEFANSRFADPFWERYALTCMGCGACAFTCPTCHCFDIVDGGPAAGNARVRTWDTCQFPIFTAHASGHNPRSDQASRQRQRMLHKFSMYPEKFGEILCTGCGNCARNCPAGMGVLSVATEMDHEKSYEHI